MCVYIESLQWHQCTCRNRIYRSDLSEENRIYKHGEVTVNGLNRCQERDSGTMRDGTSIYKPNRTIRPNSYWLPDTWHRLTTLLVHGEKEGSSQQP